MTRIVTFLTSWDERIVTGFSRRRSPMWNQFMALVTRIGDGWGWLALAAGIAVFDPGDAGFLLLQMSLGVSLEIIFYKMLKRSFSRERPYRKCGEVSCVVMPPDEFSFPSGHTAAAFTVLSIAGAAYEWLLLPLLWLAALIGLSRIYLGVHYPSDVGAGVLLGILCGEVAKGLI